MRTTREQIEAELLMSAEEKTVANIRRAVHDVQRYDAMLSRLELLAGLPLFNRSKSISERLRALGFAKELIEEIDLCFEALDAIREDRAVPERTKALLAEREAAEQSALDQLEAIVKAHSAK
jgi:uroporphyrinogen-III synthase